MLELVYLSNQISSGPEATLELLEEEFDKILSHRGACEVRIWGIGVGIPGPVEFSTVCAVAPSIMPGGRSTTFAGGWRRGTRSRCGSTTK